MSASAKKKLRKEQNAAQLTEKQRKEQKEAKKLNIYTGIFLIALAVILVAALAITGMNFYKNSGIVERNTVAAVVGEDQLSSVDVSFYYRDLVATTYSQWENTYGENMNMFLGFMGLDTTLPLDEQAYSEDMTWADYFVDGAIERAKNDLILCKAAEAENFVLPEDDQLSLEDSVAQLEMFATFYGYPDTESYLRAMYGPGSTVEAFEEYNRKSITASAYYLAHEDSLKLTQDDWRAYEEDKFNNFSSFSFATYHLNYADYLTGGTEGEDGETVYTEAEENAARDAAKADAQLLAKSTSLDELNAAIAELPKNADSETAKATVFNDSLYTATSTLYRDWLADESRQEGDCTMVSAEGDVVNDYYAVLYLDRNDNMMPLSNVRHILVSFQGGTTDDTGNTVYSDEEKAAAKSEAEAILAELNADGVITEDEFAAAVTEKSDDTASSYNGGLFEDITPEDGVYVEPFKNWATDEARQAGDTGIIETVYGYHIMFYVGDDEMTYRDHMINNEMVTNAMNEWFDSLTEGVSVEKKDVSRIETDLVLNK